MKWCAKCEQHKPLDEFYRAAKSADGRQWRCKQCAKASALENYYADHEANKDKARERAWARNQSPEVREAKRAADRAAYRRNPAPYKTAWHKRRARILAAPVNYFTDRDWQRIIARQRGECFYCHEVAPLTKEHLIPLTRGGAHSVGNIVGACSTCNCRKRTKTRMEFLVWLRRKAVA